jgi:hypothetical protein
MRPRDGPLVALSALQPSGRTNAGFAKRRQAAFQTGIIELSHLFVL